MNKWELVEDVMEHYMLDYYVYIFKNIFQEFLETCLVTLAKVGGAHPKDILYIIVLNGKPFREAQFLTGYIL